MRRHAQETGQRYTESLTDLEGVEARLFHEPVPERLLAHLRDRYGIDAVAATRASQHNDHVFRVDRRDGDPWIARVYPPARPRVGVEGDAAILRFLERQEFPAERLAVDDAVSALDGASVLVTGSSMAESSLTAMRRSACWVTCSDGCMRWSRTTRSAARVERLVMTLTARAARVRI